MHTNMNTLGKIDDVEKVVYLPSSHTFYARVPQNNNKKQEK